MKDYYKILGVNKNSSEEDIRMAYKKLAMKYHPDRNPNNPKSEEKFKDVKEAYENLTNKNKSYSDEFNANVNFGDFSNTESSLDDIFNVIFRRNYRKDNRIYYSLDVELEWAIYGAFINIKIPSQGECPKCFGKGYLSGSEIKICPKCNGVGMYTIIQGIFNFKQKCYRCNGKGYVSKENCYYCLGRGKVNKNYLCLVTLKKNSDNNSFVSIKSNDNFLKNQIVVFIKIKPHSIFSRIDSYSNDLNFDFYIDFIKASLGGYIRVFTIYGFILYKIGNISYGNKTYKLSNFGLNFNNKFGDLYLNIIVEIISNININQWILINKLKLYVSNFNYFLINDINKKISFFYKLVFSS